LTAACLKLYGLALSPFAQYEGFLSPAIQSVTIAWEVLLGVWLLTGVCRFLSWLAAVTTFIVFAGASGYLGLIGQARCGCFGTVDVNPSSAFAVDLLAIGLLVIGRPAWQGRAANAIGLQWLAGLAILLAIVAALGIGVFGSIEASIANLRGDTLSVTPAILDFGAGTPGEKLTAIAEIRNWTTGPVRLIGGTSDCVCISTLDLPMRIEPGESARVTVLLRVPKSERGRLRRFVTLLTDNPAQPTVKILVEWLSENPGGPA
jgi:hypothetical protein